MPEKQEEFIVSARKYRPESWKEVIGQEAITETLHNAIDQNHMAHAYLFCGPRGVGKTTCARIFAKEINRSEDHAEDEDFAFNIFELDAASNNSVDDIRSLTDQVRIPPQVGKYKVYIIDEVHMLSKAAFNAFLKTLEEPPKHAIFILATTEKHKIIPTILSRCQIYDFSRIKVDDIVQQLEHIAMSEKVTYEGEALHIIAQKADGAMRDALSIFDQLSSLTNDTLTYESVLKNLHVLDYDYFFGIIDHLVSREYGEVLVTFDSILQQGFDGAHFLEGLGNHLRDLLVCKDPKTLPLLEVGDSVRGKYADQAQRVEASWIMDALKQVVEAEFKYRTSSHQRLLVETMLLGLASMSTAEKKKPDTQPEPLVPKNRSKALHTEDQKIAPSQPLAEPETEQPETKAADTPKEAPTEEPTIGSDCSEHPESPSADPPIETSSGEQKVARRQRKVKTVSLKLEDDEAPTKAEEPSVNSTPEDDQSTKDQMSLPDAWKHITDHAMQIGNRALYGILVKQNVEAQLDGHQLTVSLSHEIDQEEFGHHSADVLSELRKLTGDAQLEMKTTIRQEQHEEKLFTPQDKFEHLAKQNPLLRKLKSDLDLDISY